MTQRRGWLAQHVVAKSAQLRFRLTAKTAPAPLLLLSNANPLCWASRWGPSAAVSFAEHFKSAPFGVAGLKFRAVKRRAAQCAAPTANAEAVSPSRRGRTPAGPIRSYRERWLRKLRRGSGTAPLNQLPRGKFCTRRPPVGPDGTAPRHSWFCAPGLSRDLSGGVPVNGVREKAAMSTKCSSEPSPAILW